LHRLHRKGPVATKLTRLQPTRLPEGAMLQAFHKAKDIPELKSTLHQIWDDLPQTTTTKLSTTFANIWTRVFRLLVDFLSTLN